LEENKAESDILAIPLTPALAVATFAVPDANGEVPEGAIAVTSGWNLLGVPWNVRMAADYELERGRMTYDEAGGQALVPATSLSTGDAVWVFLEDGQQFVLYGETTAPPAQPSSVPGWTFMANPGELQAGTRWFWAGSQFTTEPPAQPEWQGVWFLPTQE
ncbi:MAG: hypothetical protein PHC30_08885, partial [Lentisphaeria bacterium]|nr:hypothetical protein [Lentisphaeria bacterium]